MRTIKTYSKRAPFYNAFIVTDPADEAITSDLPVTQEESLQLAPANFPGRDYWGPECAGPVRS